ncbi:hypothetical protein L3Y34_009985 [Caenorhabditis briggsae]|uniref:Nuclear receptor domain-containing protein n=1 Tax=Caenorhabditis briggsae TaxID=6238 RepID=A0AAE9D323_CAEBR|nr:hypothetical protein L3Y34_009985 [Caenorhabditis briggsae]
MSISSSSSEFSPDLSYFAVKCKICSKTGHGLHFGLETCRACAAFFRRTVVLNRKYKCRKRVGHCEILLEDDQNSKSPCKFCRFKKCLDMGMTSEKSQNYKPEGSKCSQKYPEVDSPSTSSALSEREEQIAYNIAHPKTRGPAILLDINAIIKKSRTILETYYLPDEDSISHSNPLQRMVHSIQKLRSRQNWNPEFREKIEFIEMFYGWEAQMRDAATWLMYCNEFRGLPEHERIAIFKIVWAVWRRFERFTMTAKIFGQRCYDEKIYLHSHQYAIHMEAYSIDYSKVSDHGFDKFNNVFGGKMIQYYEIIVKPFLDLKLSETEITFILCQIVWNYAGRRLQGQTQAAGERFLEEISNNLHSYYEENSGSSGRIFGDSENPGNPQNYASRLARMMQIVNQMLNVQLHLENTINIAFLFDMFNIVFTEPEFFRC